MQQGLDSLTFSGPDEPESAHTLSERALKLVKVLGLWLGMGLTRPEQGSELFRQGVGVDKLFLNDLR